MRRRTRHFTVRDAIALGVTCAVTTLAAGCSSSESSNAGSSNAGSSTSAGGNSPKKVTVGIGLTLTGIPSFADMITGAKAAGVKANATVQAVGPATATGSGEANMAQNLETSLQPNGFAVNPCILNAWSRTISSILSSVPEHNVIALGCPPISSATGKTPLKIFVGPNGFAQGYATAEAAIQGGHVSASATGTALIAGCDPAVPNIVEGVKGIAAALKADLPDMRVIQFTSALDQSSNTAAWTSEFSKNSGVKLAIGFCDQDAQSLLTLKQRGVGGNYVAGVAEPAGAELTAIKEGVLAGGVQQASWLQGYLAVQLLARQARGQAVPSGWLDSGNFIITKANVDAWIAAGSSSAAQEKLLLPVANEILADLDKAISPLGDAFSVAKPPTTVVG